jgi:type I restriction-modification system DNA methylase subunit
LVKLAVLLPVSAAIWTDNIITEEKKKMLEDNTLEAVFTLPNEVFYPWASVSACCMLFTLGKPHSKDKETFFWYYKEDWFKKKKNLWRVEQFDSEDNSIRSKTMDNWLQYFINRKVIDWISATAIVSWEDERLCEAYMKTDYSKLSEKDFQKTINNYLAYLVWNWIINETKDNI